MSQIKCLLYMLLFLGFSFSRAQPLRSSKQLIAGVSLFQDLKKDHLFYYSPNHLELAIDKQGYPRISIIRMSYIGTAITGNQGEKSTMNIAQFTVHMPPLSSEQIKAIGTALSIDRLILKPLPIKNLEAYLVVPLEGKYKRIGGNMSQQGEGSLGMGDGSSYWEERTFTMRLTHIEAELLNKMLEDQQLSVSVNYSFYSDMTIGYPIDREVSGDSAFQEAIQGQLDVSETFDSTVSTLLVHADAFSIGITPTQCPKCFRNIDINGESPPSYPIVEVRCYDFTEDLRPDLFMKTIEIEAIDVNGSPRKARKIRFKRSHPDLNSQQVNFPFAIRMDRPLRYRVNEFTLDGEEKADHGWKTKDNWLGVIDITTPARENAFEKILVEIETSPHVFEQDSVESIEIQVVYPYEESMQEIAYKFLPKQPTYLFPASLVKNKNSLVKCLITWNFQDKSVQREAKIFGVDNYLYLSP